MATTTNVFAFSSARRSITAFILLALALTFFFSNASEIEPLDTCPPSKGLSDVCMERTSPITPHDPVSTYLDVEQDPLTNNNDDISDVIDSLWATEVGGIESDWLLDLLRNQHSSNDDELSSEKTTSFPVHSHDSNTQSHKNARLSPNEFAAKAKNERNDNNDMQKFLNEMRNGLFAIYTVIDDSMNCCVLEGDITKCVEKCLSFPSKYKGLLGKQFWEHYSKYRDLWEKTKSQIEHAVEDIAYQVASSISQDDINFWNSLINNFNFEESVPKGQQAKDTPSLEDVLRSFEVSNKNEKTQSVASENSAKPEAASTSEEQLFEDFTHRVSSCSDFSNDEAGCNKVQRCKFTQADGNSGSVSMRCSIAPAHMKYLVQTDCKQESRGDLLAVARDVFFEGFMDYSTLSFLRNSQDAETICRAVTHSYFSVPQPEDAKTSLSDEGAVTAEWNKMGDNEKLEQVLSMVADMLK
ncbi:hypothetical protein IE077_001400 [Cardiosporidium cionae]|uniref:Transmembrane protein n=1 Tax=Cardiosporidium cionae TaxID=476202 RepID=A0ABQ7JCZ2_9APIC|nr:hypothetical protein IE077_001400 [Cardiosporidium cionae]|eukprot:KAF8821892.1 hypothetical protein IE077_001400 [Cardiosporidium cionae]